VVPIAAKLVLKFLPGFCISNNPINTAVPMDGGRSTGQPLSGTIRAWSSATSAVCAAICLSTDLAAMIRAVKGGYRAGHLSDVW